MYKFGRNYVLSVETNSGAQLVIKPPFTIEFDIERNILTSANTCSIRIYNLNENSRNQLRFNMMSQTVFKSIELKAGYGTTNLPVIFSGNLTEGWSVREGVNFITTLECFDGGYAMANGDTTTAFPGGTQFDSVIQTLAESLPQTKPGAIGTTPGSLSRGNSYVGNTMDLLRSLTGGAVFIDSGQVHILADDEYVNDGPPALINASSGLLGTPKREQNLLHFDILFAPEIQTGRIIQLSSLTDPTFNGLKKVVGVSHKGMISEAVCGDAITSVSTWYSKEFVPVEIG